MIHQSSIIDSKSNISKKVKIGQNRNIADPIIQKFELALKKLTLNLAKQVVVDGEGAKKFVTIKVINAQSILSGKKIAFSVANSPLVKTAIAGEDPNWGRVIMGIGKSGENIDKNKLTIKFGEYLVCEKGQISESYDENKIKEYMEWDSVLIEINLIKKDNHFQVVPNINNFFQILVE